MRITAILIIHSLKATRHYPDNRNARKQLPMHIYMHKIIIIVGNSNRKGKTRTVFYLQQGSGCVIVPLGNKHCKLLRECQQ